ncbi:hypothetical protein EV207_12511 [Scopulibacillus darangshiensis]|uniref:Ribbon-helix-helix CopG family protein n=1 Tax=Scopulibacillus darangshiensis TaxID=442528 RepID=A0A4R2NSD4_9BACL|nr:ribbon-helix-helix domain-containing protein [Scopulibacillus darangshiensis]TCP24451.1 hypothetical protein EV207_12511 [Scopulibacillus darangshiensis]
MKNEKKPDEFSSIHIKLSNKFLNELDEFTTSFNFTNRTEAMRYLLSLGLKYQKGLLKDKMSE